MRQQRYIQSIHIHIRQGGDDFDRNNVDEKKIEKREENKGKWTMKKAKYT
jgi:hypothetical protein